MGGHHSQRSFINTWHALYKRLALYVSKNGNAAFSLSRMWRYISCLCALLLSVFIGVGSTQCIFWPSYDRKGRAGRPRHVRVVNGCFPTNALCLSRFLHSFPACSLDASCCTNAARAKTKCSLTWCGCMTSTGRHEADRPAGTVKKAGFSLILGKRKERARRGESSCSFYRLGLAGYFQVAPSIDKLAPLLMSADQLHNPEQGFAAPIRLLLQPRTRAVALVLASRQSSCAVCCTALDFDWTSN